MTEDLTQEKIDEINAELDIASKEDSEEVDEDFNEDGEEELEDEDNIIDGTGQTDEDLDFNEEEDLF